MNRWYRVVAYDPITETCTLAPASQSQAGLLYDVPVGRWGGSWQAQKRSPLKLTDEVNPADWGNSAQGPRWGISFPIQQGDLALVEFADGDQSSPVIAAFSRGIVGTLGAAFVGAEQGESPYDRFDILLPSGAWARALSDGTWILSTPAVGAPASSITIGADGTITLTGSALVVNTPTVTVNGVTTFTESGQNINGQDITVIGGVDDRGHRIVTSGQ